MKRVVLNIGPHEPPVQSSILLPLPSQDAAQERQVAHRPSRTQEQARFCSKPSNLEQLKYQSYLVEEPKLFKSTNNFSYSTEKGPADSLCYYKSKFREGPITSRPSDPCHDDFSKFDMRVKRLL